VVPEIASATSPNCCKAVAAGSASVIVAFLDILKG